MHLNLIMYVLSHALGPTGRYSVLSFRISTVFDINPLELVRFRVRLYRFRFRFRISNVKVENNLGVFRPFLTVFILTY